MSEITTFVLMAGLIVFNGVCTRLCVTWFGRYKWPAVVIILIFLLAGAVKLVTLIAMYEVARSQDFKTNAVIFVVVWLGAHLVANLVENVKLKVDARPSR